VSDDDIKSSVLHGERPAGVAARRTAVQQRYKQPRPSKTACSLPSALALVVRLGVQRLTSARHTAAGWGNLMRQKEEEASAGGAGGAECALSDAELARLLDREHVYADDIASGADAGEGWAALGCPALPQPGQLGLCLELPCWQERLKKANLLRLLLCTRHSFLLGCAVALPHPSLISGPPHHPPPTQTATLLGEVRAGGAAAMKFDGGDGGGDGGPASAAQDAEMEAAMLRLIQERARKYEADKAVRTAGLRCSCCACRRGGALVLRGEDAPPAAQRTVARKTLSRSTPTLPWKSNPPSCAARP
jgi:hypothetical protein